MTRKTRVYNESTIFVEFFKKTVLKVQAARVPKTRAIGLRNAIVPWPGLRQAWRGWMEEFVNEFSLGPVKMPDFS